MQTSTFASWGSLRLASLVPWLIHYSVDTVPKIVKLRYKFRYIVYIYIYTYIHSFSMFHFATALKIPPWLLKRRWRPQRRSALFRFRLRRGGGLCWGLLRWWGRYSPHQIYCEQSHLPPENQAVRFKMALLQRLNVEFCQGSVTWDLPLGILLC